MSEFLTKDFFEEKLGRYKRFALYAKDIHLLFGTSKGMEMQKDLNQLFAFLKERELKRNE